MIEGDWKTKTKGEDGCGEIECGPFLFNWFAREDRNICLLKWPSGDIYEEYSWEYLVRGNLWDEIECCWALWGEDDRVG